MSRRRRNAGTKNQKIVTKREQQRKVNSAKKEDAKVREFNTIITHHNSATDNDDLAEMACIRVASKINSLIANDRTGVAGKIVSDLINWEMLSKKYKMVNLDTFPKLVKRILDKLYGALTNRPLKYEYVIDAVADMIKRDDICKTALPEKEFTRAGYDAKDIAASIIYASLVAEEDRRQAKVSASSDEKEMIEDETDQQPDEKEEKKEESAENKEERESVDNEEKTVEEEKVEKEAEPNTGSKEKKKKQERSEATIELDVEKVVDDMFDELVKSVEKNGYKNVKLENLYDLACKSVQIDIDTRPNKKLTIEEYNDFVRTAFLSAKEKILEVLSVAATQVAEEDEQPCADTVGIEDGSGEYVDVSIDDVPEEYMLFFVRFPKQYALEISRAGAIIDEMSDSDRKKERRRALQYIARIDSGENLRVGTYLEDLKKRMSSKGSTGKRMFA